MWLIFGIPAGYVIFGAVVVLLLIVSVVVQSGRFPRFTEHLDHLITRLFQ